MPAPNTVTSITTGGANLFALAAQQYGDPSQWYRIAALNGVWDFLLTGTPLKLDIPPPINPAATNGGILGL